MEQLIQQLTEKYEMSEEDAADIINTVNNYKAATETAVQTAAAPAATAAVKEESMFEKAEHFVTDHLPGGLKDKAEQMLGGLGDKVKGMFN
jgi:uncharacterized protein YgbK (DUF1537 family)